MSQKNVKFIRPKREDWQDMQCLYETSLTHNRHGFMQDVAFHGGIGDFCQKCFRNGGDMLIAKCGDEVVGFGGLMPIDSQQVELCKLHVKQTFQGFGIGKSLCRRLISNALALGFKDLVLHVTATQSAALNLYQWLGFDKVGQELIKVRHNDSTYEFDTVFMHLPLPAMSTSPEQAREFISAFTPA